MKLLSIILLLYFVAPGNMKTNFVSNDKSVNVCITYDLLTCISSLEHDTDKWSVKHVKPLKKGVNEFGFVSRDKQRIEITIINY